LVEIGNGGGVDTSGSFLELVQVERRGFETVELGGEIGVIDEASLVSEVELLHEDVVVGGIGGSRHFDSIEFS
jgi:hypothetical protein